MCLHTPLSHVVFTVYVHVQCNYDYLYIPVYRHPCTPVDTPKHPLIHTEQATIFDSTDILLMSHGAAAMNLHFLPLVSVVIDINSWYYGSHQASIVAHMPPPYRIQQFTLNKFNVRDTEPVVGVLGGMCVFRGSCCGLISTTTNPCTHIQIRTHTQLPRRCLEYESI